MNPLSPHERYKRDQQENGFLPDFAQEKAVDSLQALYLNLIEYHKPKPVLHRLLKRVGLRKRPPIKGLYFWGGVGRGKTYLMDLFFDSLPYTHKLRTHFHRFMRSVHHELDLVKNQKDPLELVAEKFADRYWVICFDEFFVVDITDAMILSRLLDGLFRRGVTLVTTSNIVPNGLYKEGLQRERFIPAIRLLEQYTVIVNVDGGVDYRLRALTQSSLYYSPIDEHSESEMAKCFSQLAPLEGHIEENVEIDIERRTIRALKVAEDVAWFEFGALCDGPRSQHDYIELAREFQTVLVSGVPIFTDANSDQARRFIYLVDEFYDRSVKLVLSAQAPFLALYPEGRFTFEFERTQSRLQEMQSEEYLSRAHKG